MFEAGLTGPRRLDIQDFASLIKAQTRRGKRTPTILLLRGVFAGGLGLFVGFGEGAAENPGSGDDDLSDETVSLRWGRESVRNLRSWIRMHRSVRIELNHLTMSAAYVSGPGGGRWSLGDGRKKKGKISAACFSAGSRRVESMLIDVDTEPQQQAGDPLGKT